MAKLYNSSKDREKKVQCVIFSTNMAKSTAKRVRCQEAETVQETEVVLAPLERLRPEIFYEHIALFLDGCDLYSLSVASKACRRLANHMLPVRAVFVTEKYPSIAALRYSVFVFGCVPRFVADRDTMPGVLTVKGTEDDRKWALEKKLVCKEDFEEAASRAYYGDVNYAKLATKDGRLCPFSKLKPFEKSTGFPGVLDTCCFYGYTEMFVWLTKTYMPQKDVGRFAQNSINWSLINTAGENGHLDIFKLLVPSPRSVDSKAFLEDLDSDCHIRCYWHDCIQEYAFGDSQFTRDLGGGPRYSRQEMRPGQRYVFFKYGRHDGRDAYPLAIDSDSD